MTYFYLEMIIIGNINSLKKLQNGQIKLTLVGELLLKTQDWMKKLNKNYVLSNN